MSIEVAITSDVSGLLWNCCVWNADTGTSLMHFKGGISGPSTLCLIKENYLISSFKDKQVLNIWNLSHREQLEQKMICPGKVTAVAVSPCGNYCIVAIIEKIHIWQISSGCLLSVLHHHYQAITCLKFSGDGFSFVSGGDDSLVLAWNLVDVLNPNELTSVQPKHIWNQHSLPITDVFVGKSSSSQARVASVSLDQTCKIFDVNSGQLLLSIMLDAPLCSVTMDNCEYHLFIGSSCGKIFRFNLFDPPRTVEHHYKETKENIYHGHEKRVVSLSVSMDGNTLLSGSHDSTVRLWDVKSLNCKRILNHKGPITNAFITLLPMNIINSKSGKNAALPQFKRYLHKPSQNGENDNDEVIICLDDNEEIRERRHEVDNYLDGDKNSEYINKNNEMACEIMKLKEVNKQIYLTAMDHALRNPKSVFK